MRAPLLTQWKIAFPNPARTFLDNWMQRKEGPAPLSRRERADIKRVAAAARRKAHPRETGRTPGFLAISEKKGKRTRPISNDPPGRLGPKNRPIPPVGRSPAQPREKTPSRVNEAQNQVSIFQSGIF